MVYQYRNHLPVLFGAGAVSLLGEKVREFGCKKVMCVCDAGVRKSGIADKATASLEAAGIGYVVFDQITSDPTDLAVDTGGEIARKEGVDAVVGIGGGSSMDAAKAISLLIEHEPPIRQYMSMPPVMTESTVPQILVPTTSGTGSEVTLVGIITNTQNHEKEAVALQAALAVLDPELCRTAPPSVTAYTGLDALSHALEAITARRRNPFSEHIACGAISKIMRSLPAAYQNSNDLEARTELALASNWAGIALVDTDCHFGHCLAEGIASTFSLPHGVACAVTMIATIRMEDLNSYRNDASGRIEMLEAERKELRNGLRSAVRAIKDPEDLAAVSRAEGIRSLVNQKTEEIAALRKNIKICGRIEERASRIWGEMETLQNAEKPEGKHPERQRDERKR